MSLLRVLTNILKTNSFKQVNIKSFSQFPNLSCSSKSKNKNENNNDDNGKPIKYSVSPASKWKAEQSRSGNKSPRLWYEPYVVIASVTAILIYFCVLREENDIDLELQRSLYARIEGLEEHQLRVLLDYNNRHGLDTQEIVKRLREIESSRK